MNKPYRPRPPKSLNDLIDVDLSNTPSSVENDILTYDGSVWVSNNLSLDNLMQTETSSQSRPLFFAYYDYTQSYTEPASVADACTILGLTYSDVMTNGVFPSGLTNATSKQLSLDAIWKDDATSALKTPSGDIGTTKFQLYRWLFILTPPVSGNFTFYPECNGCVDLRVDTQGYTRTETLVINSNGTATVTERSGLINLQRGSLYYGVLAHLVPTGENPIMRFRWQRPGQITPKQPVYLPLSGIKQPSYTCSSGGAGIFNVTYNSILPATNNPTVIATANYDGTYPVLTASVAKSTNTGFTVRLRDIDGNYYNGSGFNFVVVSRGKVFINGEVDGSSNLLEETNHYP